MSDNNAKSQAELQDTLVKAYNDILTSLEILSSDKYKSEVNKFKDECTNNSRCSH